MQPKISIIIATKNAGTQLLETLSNLHEQRYPNLEVIVVDGNSSDGTQDELERYNHVVTRWISESDAGISEAFNKGIALATGEYINFQGAGDLLCHPNVLSELFHGVSPTSVIVCGRVNRVSEEGQSLIWTSSLHPKQFRPSSLLMKMSLPHQALFMHRRYFEEFGLFDHSVRFAMDYELLLRAYNAFPETTLKNVIVAHWRAGGVGTNRIHEIFDEYHRIKMKHKVANPLILKVIDRLTRLKYSLKTKYLKMTY